MSTGLWAAVSAVIIDSIVTLYVGWRLNRTARQEAVKAAETVKPVLQKELETAALILIPLIVQELKKHIGDRDKQDAPIRAIQTIGSPESSTHYG